jgi:hypothetical protein
MGEEMEIMGPRRVLCDGHEIDRVISVTEHSSVDEMTTVTIKLYGVTVHSGNDEEGRQIDIVSGFNVGGLDIHKSKHDSM